MAQIAAQVGDIDGNVARVLSAWRDAAARGADVVVFTELTITGYPPEDLLHLSGFVEHNLAVLDELAARAGHCVTIVGFVDPVPARATYHPSGRESCKSHLPF
jgi:predicted amidohydrolase